jgi:hypothetical protein
MGQYYLIANTTKKQFIKPNRFGDGLKLREFGTSGFGTMYALAALLASGNNRGGGDIPSDNPVIGSWAGDSIVIAGDYGDEGLFTEDKTINLYQEASSKYVNISNTIHECLIETDDYYRQQWDSQNA